MSIELIKKAWKIDKSHLSVAQKTVLTRMLGFGDSKGESIFPSWSTLQKETNLSRMSIYRSIKYLTEKGILIKVQEANKKIHFSAIYKANICLLDELISSSI